MVFRDGAGLAEAMADKLTPEQRSSNMRAIRSRDTAPERRLRSILHRAGFRFRLSRHSLPGRPDIVMPRWRAIVFMHGCYWHGHGCSRGGTGAKSNQDYWGPKVVKTKERDRRNQSELEAMGWNVITVWECELSEPEAVRLSIERQIKGLA